MFSEIVQTLLEFVSSLGYVGIFVMTFLEATFVPIPSEVTLIPAGYLVAQGEFNIYILFLYSISGTVLGALANYYIAYRYGERILFKYGKYIFFTTNKMKKIQKFFSKHGKVSVFIGRILPGLKHFISFPAGLAKMNIYIFTLYSAIGGGIWCVILLISGYLIGINEKEIHQYTSYINYGVFAIASIAAFIYIIRFTYIRRKRKLEKSQN